MKRRFNKIKRKEISNEITDHILLPLPLKQFPHRPICSCDTQVLFHAKIQVQ